MKKIGILLIFVFTIGIFEIGEYQNVNAAKNNDKSVVEKYYPELKKLADNGVVELEINAKEYFTLGKWNKKDIVWQILKYSKDGKSALVISRDVLFSRPYDENQERYPDWSSSSLRKYLNEDFYKNAFSKKERKLIKKVILKNKSFEGWDYSSFNVEIGGYERKNIITSLATKDRVFILSPDDAYKYFKNDLERAAYYINSINVSEQWWLRWMGGPLATSCVDIRADECDGDDSMLNNEYVGVRPVMWVKLTTKFIEKNNLSGGKGKEEFYKQATKNDVVIIMGNNNSYANDIYDNDVTPLRWKIIEYDSKNKRALLLSEQYIYFDNFNQKGGSTWEKSSIRKWLNEKFYEQSFTEKEKNVIKSTTVRSENNPILLSDEF